MARRAFPAAERSFHFSALLFHAPGYAGSARELFHLPGAKRPAPLPSRQFSGRSSWHGLLLALARVRFRSFVRDQRRHRPIVRSKILLGHTLHIFLRHRVVVLRRLEQFVVIPEKYLIRSDCVRPSADRAHLPVKFRQPYVFSFFQFSFAYSARFHFVEFLVNRFFTLFRIDAYLRLRAHHAQSRIEGIPGRRIHRQRNFILVHQPLIHPRTLALEQNRPQNVQRIKIWIVRPRYVIGDQQQRQFRLLVDHQATLPQLLRLNRCHRRRRCVRRNALQIFLAERKNLFGSHVSRPPSWRCSGNNPSRSGASNPRWSSAQCRSSIPPPATDKDARCKLSRVAARQESLRSANPRWSAVRWLLPRARSRFFSGRNSNPGCGPLRYRKSIRGRCAETSTDTPWCPARCRRCSIRRWLPAPCRVRPARISWRR